MTVVYASTSVEQCIDLQTLPVEYLEALEVIQHAECENIDTQGLATALISIVGAVVSVGCFCCCLCSIILICKCVNCCKKASGWHNREQRRVNPAELYGVSPGDSETV